MKRINHHAVNWSGEDIKAFMECSEHYETLPIKMLTEEYLSIIMEDVFYEYEDYIIEKINYFIQEYLYYHRERLVKEIKNELI